MLGFVIFAAIIDNIQSTIYRYCRFESKVKCIETIFTRLVILSVDDVRVTCRNARLLCYDTDSFLQSLAGHSYSAPDRDRLSIVLYPVFPRLEYIAGYGVSHSYDEHKHQI